ncbi:cytochrome d ubiquinol oxidase subunit II [Nitrospira sp. MA-1]|nr:cytochrome d ubiquinol oxidase subunit II [Nitrospira sp. MA-1]
MPGLEEIIAGCIVISLTLYALLGGADYGAGIWYLLARGPEAQTQRHLISTAIGPIWEANHVWLILVITLLFSAFPLAYARISTVLHIPLTLLLTGIVFRGSAFAFRSYDVQQSPLHRFWGTLFGLSSLITAMFLGIILGTLTSSYLQNVQGGFVDVFVLPWIQPFPLAVGIWTITLFAFLASTYLIHETPLPALRGLYRRKALWSLADFSHNGYPDPPPHEKLRFRNQPRIATKSKRMGISHSGFIRDAGKYNWAVDQTISPRPDISRRVCHRYYLGMGIWSISISHKTRFNHFQHHGPGFNAGIASLRIGGRNDCGLTLTSVPFSCVQKNPGVNQPIQS